MDGLPWGGLDLTGPSEQAAAWLLNSLAPGGAGAGAPSGDYLLTAGALTLMAAAGTPSALIRRTREILDLPFELSYALDAGLRAEGIADLDSLEAPPPGGRPPSADL
eukprot:918871-Alexandrium_andersonii.AAC.1